MSRRQPKPTGRSQRHKNRPASAAADASPSRREQLAALAAESDRQLEELIARRLALPLEKRMNFLRRRLPGGGSCL
jgi:hypothetical protein